ncbi:MAG: hypothetical protein M3N24_10410, partial [Actinomycetota bacterium]|nr:hypothetical protein [Actinomycetota bacterium]
MVFTRIAKDERGIAMITAVLVSGVVLVLTTVVLQLSIHNTARSGEDRRRVQAIAAAEAGIDYYFSYLTQTGGQAIQCVIQKPMQGSPGSFRVQAFFYDNNGVALSPSCPPGPTTPGYVMLYSEGRSGAATPVRRMQAYARLTVTTGNTFDNAGVIFAQNSVNFTSNARIGGAQHNDADVYTNGNVTLSSNSTIFGRIYSQGMV